MATKSKGNDDLLITCIAEPIWYISGALFKLIVFLFKKYVLQLDKGKLQKIEFKTLRCKRQTIDKKMLGVDTANQRPVDLSSINFSKHTFIVGASGFGKTNLIGVLQDHDLVESRPIIYIDPKGDLGALKDFVSITKGHQRKTFIFSESQYLSTAINPIKDGSVNQIADRIVRAFEWSETYYKDVAHRTLLKALRELEDDDSDISLNSLYGLLIRKYESKETVGLISKIENIVKSDFGKLLHGENALSVSEIREKNINIYIGLSTQGYGETARAIGKLILGDLLYNSYRELKLGSDLAPISVYFDEFGSIVMPEFIELLNKCRAAKIRLTMAVQSIADIETLNPYLANQIIENTSNIFILKQRLDSSASFFSDSIGTHLTEKKTLVYEDGNKTGKESVREVHELLVHPDVIKNLGIGQCIMLTHDPKSLKLINLRKVEEKTDFNLHKWLSTNLSNANEAFHE